MLTVKKCTFCKRETEKLVHLFWDCPVTQSFWISLSSWLQSCQVFEREMMLQLGTALGLKPDISKYKLQINICCLLAKYYIWICKLNTFPPILYFLYETYIFYAMAKKSKTFNQNKWEPLESFL